MEISNVKAFAERVIENIEQVIVGKRPVVELLLVAMLCDGHVLIEDVPGVGKTMLARALAITLGGSFKRLQCTPDLMPNDVTGVSVYNQKTGEFEFREGPVFVNVLLADEINRATPRTQSALLEAMQEVQVTVDGVTRPLPRPFLVMATQNPVEFEGTFPLPEAQLDRFFLRVEIGYPSLDDERQILVNLQREHPIHRIGPAAEAAALREIQSQIWDVHLDRSLQDYILQIVQRTRDHPELALGASPRGSLALHKGAQALAALRGRDYVLPDDIQYLAPMALAHRLMIRPESELRGRSAAEVLDEILESVPLQLEEEN